MDVLKTSIPEHIYESLINASITNINEFILKTTEELCDLTGCQVKDVKLVKSEVSKIILKNKMRPVSQLKDWKRLSTGLEKIDKIIRGGMPANGINEIYGQSGVGKTQFCLQLGLMVQLPKSLGGFEKGVLYICTEDVFPLKRLQQMTNGFYSKYSTLDINFEDNIFIENIADIEQLVTFIDSKINSLVISGRIGLIIVDSIASIFRCEEMNYASRSEIFRKIAIKLYEISEQDIVVLCVNQVSDNIDKHCVIPALGLAWSNLVTCRFQIKRTTEHNSIRSLEIIFAPDLQSTKAHFIITNTGLYDISSNSSENDEWK